MYSSNIMATRYTTNCKRVRTSPAGLANLEDRLCVTRSTVPECMTQEQYGGSHVHRVGHNIEWKTCHSLFHEDSKIIPKVSTCDAQANVGTTNKRPPKRKQDHRYHFKEGIVHKFPLRLALHSFHKSAQINRNLLNDTSVPSANPRGILKQREHSIL